jgi:hypothetical protein
MVGLLPQSKKKNELGSITLTNKASGELSCGWERIVLRQCGNCVAVR